MIPTPEEIEQFKELVERYRYDFCKLVFIIFPFGEAGSDLEHKMPYAWQMRQWAKLSKHLADPATRYETYRLIVSSGNGAAKTAFGAMTYFMLMYTQKLRGKITANTKPQMTGTIWPEYDVWFRKARYSNHYFEKLGESIKARDPELSETWRLDVVTWNEGSPAAISGLHNAGHAVIYIFEEAPGIPAVIWDYAKGAFSDKDTIRIWLAFGNSDDPESKFEQNMSSPDWHSLRIDTRTLDHVDKNELEVWLREAGGDEDHDDFRVRVRGLPRKSSKDAIISHEIIAAALERRFKFDIASVQSMPAILMCDPAWTGGDYTTIWYMQGNYARLLEKYQLIKDQEDHSTTYFKMVEYERLLKIDAVMVDQGEGTGIITLARGAGKYNWHLVAFGSNPNDNIDPKQSPYGNLRAQMYYMGRDWLRDGGVLDARDESWINDIEKQLSWTKGARHKVTGKKMCEAKVDIKERVGASPDVADGFVLGFAHRILERLEEHVSSSYQTDAPMRASVGPIELPDFEVNYDD